MLRRDLSGTIDLPPGVMESRRGLDRLRRFALFGNGRWSRVSRIGPHRRLLGRRVGTAARSAPASAAPPGSPSRATWIGVNPRSAELPTLAAGRLKGGSPTGGRDLALAVNGRIAQEWAAASTWPVTGPNGSRSTCPRRRCARGATR